MPSLIANGLCSMSPDKSIHLFLSVSIVIFVEFSCLISKFPPFAVFSKYTIKVFTLQSMPPLSSKCQQNLGSNGVSSALDK